MSCYFNEGDVCIITKEKCTMFNVRYVCETHEKHNPLNLNRIPLFIKRILAVGKNLGLSLDVKYVVSKNIAMIEVYENKKKIVEIKDDFNIPIFETVKKIKDSLVKTDSILIKKEITLTNDEIIQKALEENKSISDIVQTKIYDKHNIEIELLNSAKSENTIVVRKDGIKRLHYVNMNLDDFIKNFSIKLFMEQTTYVRNI